MQIQVNHMTDIYKKLEHVQQECAVTRSAELLGLTLCTPITLIYIGITWSKLAILSSLDPLTVH